MALIPMVRKEFETGSIVKLASRVAVDSGTRDHTEIPLYEAAPCLDEWRVLSRRPIVQCVCLSDDCFGLERCGDDWLYRLSRVGQPERIRDLDSHYIFPGDATVEDLQFIKCENCQGWGEFLSEFMVSLEREADRGLFEVERNRCPYCEGCGFQEPTTTPDHEAEIQANMDPIDLAQDQAIAEMFRRSDEEKRLKSETALKGFLYDVDVLRGDRDEEEVT